MYTVQLNLPPHKMERFYSGDADQVWVRDNRGVSIRFPLEVLRPYVTHAGGSGKFQLTVGRDHKLAKVVRVS